MLIQSPLKARLITTYDILFVGGTTLRQVVDKAAGDTLISTPERLEFFTAPRPSAFNNQLTTPTKNTTIYLDKVLAITTEELEHTPIHPEQQTELRELLKKLSA